MKIHVLLIVLLAYTAAYSQVKFHSAYTEARIPLPKASMYTTPNQTGPAVGLSFSLLKEDPKVNLFLGLELSYSSYAVDDFTKGSYKFHAYRNFKAQEMSLSPFLNYVISLNQNKTWYVSPKIYVDIPVIRTRQYDYIYDGYKLNDNGESEFIGRFTEHHDEQLSFKKIGWSVALSVGRKFKLKNKLVSVDVGYRLADAKHLAPTGGAGNEGVTLRFSYFFGQLRN